jgi:hypothetical protein
MSSTAFVATGSYPPTAVDPALRLNFCFGVAATFGEMTMLGANRNQACAFGQLWTSARLSKHSPGPLSETTSAPSLSSTHPLRTMKRLSGAASRARIVSPGLK